MKVCSVCNKENNNVEGNFCIFCGGKLIEKPDNNKNEIKKEEKRVSKNNEKQKNNNINSDINKKFKIALIVLIIVLIIVSGIAIYLKISDNTSELNEEISNLKKQVSTLREEKNKLSSENASLKLTDSKNSRKIKFFDENVVFVLDGYGRYYYTYDQMAQVTQGKSFTYWAYNLEQAIELGYRAWK